MPKVLVVTQCFPPSAAAGTQRVLRVVTGMHRHGWEAHILTMGDRCHYPTDSESIAGIPDHARVHRVRCMSVWHHSNRWRQARSGIWRAYAKAVRGLARVSMPLVPLDDTYPWAIAATRVGVRLVHREGIDLIWSTSPPLTSHYLAARIAQRTGVRLIVDYRDVRRYAGVPKLSRRERSCFRMQGRILEQATGITYVAPEQHAILTACHPVVRDIDSRLVYNCFDAAEAAQAGSVQFGRPTILHGGSLYGGTRRLHGFFDALKAASDDGHRDVQFLQIGPEDTTSYLAHEVSERGLDGRVQIRPLIPRSAFLSHCRGADILLLVVGHDRGVVIHSSAIPSKLYDYFGACRPVLVLGPPECEAGKMVQRLNRGIAVDDADRGGIAEAIDLLLKGQGAGGPLDLGLEAVRAFDCRTTVATMVAFWNTCSASVLRQ